MCACNRLCLGRHAHVWLDGEGGRDETLPACVRGLAWLGLAGTWCLEGAGTEGGVLVKLYGLVLGVDFVSCKRILKGLRKPGRDPNSPGLMLLWVVRGMEWCLPRMEMVGRGRRLPCALHVGWVCVTGGQGICFVSVGGMGRVPGPGETSRLEMGCGREGQMRAREMASRILALEDYHHEIEARFRRWKTRLPWLETVVPLTQKHRGFG